jgi:NADPH2:quinone reductase
MKLEEVPDPEPQRGEVLLKLEVAGVNFIDVNERSGAYKVSMPFTPGSEGAGIVTELGEGVDGISIGDRMAFARIRRAYAEYITAPADRLVSIPEGMSSSLAAGAMLQGMTAHYLVNSICQMEPGNWCLVHAAAGGVGLLLTQMATTKGLRVIGTASSEAKGERARAAGAEHVIIYKENQFADEVMDITQGQGVRAVFESVGKTTFDESLRSLARRGFLILFGQSSGPVDPFDPRRLQHGGSLFLTRPALVDYIATREDLVQRSSAVLGSIAAGDLEIHLHATLSLSDASEAHRAIEERTTTGKLLLAI